MMGLWEHFEDFNTSEYYSNRQKTLHKHPEEVVIYLDPGIRLLKTWLQGRFPCSIFSFEDDWSEGKGLGLVEPLLLVPDACCCHYLTK